MAVRWSGRGHHHVSGQLERGRRERVMVSRLNAGTNCASASEPFKRESQHKARVRSTHVRANAPKSSHKLAQKSINFRRH